MSRPDPPPEVGVGDGTPTDPLVRVVVVTYSPGDTLETFLASLRTATSAAVEVVLADNGSRDGVPERAAAQGRARLLSTGGNVGYGSAANLGARRAGAPWLVVANPDVCWHPGSLDDLLAAAERWPSGAAFGPAIRTTDGDLYPSARALPSLVKGTGHALLGWLWPGNPWTRSYRRERGVPAEGAVGWLSGSCLLLRREAFEAVGGFDPTYFMFMEDLDLCERLGRAGWASVYVPSAVITHIGGHTWRRFPGPMLRAHHVSVHRYLSRRYSGWALAPLRLLIAVGLLARYLAAVLSRRVGEGARPARSAEVLATAAEVSAAEGPVGTTATPPRVLSGRVSGGGG